ncbi:hypothetical protein AB0J21_16685 [Streptomyces sp. NPDC049954]|uniref:hypothetical protein n=1 Tax=Streptomyces sp. NPDC049954 TaxID=3155779 RepID=UPI003444E8DA
MVGHVTVAQRRVVEAAEPVTGRLRGAATVLERLTKLGLAFRHPRPPHAYFLTPAGHRLREGRAESAPAPEAPGAGPSAGAAPGPSPAEPSAASAGFAARTGYEEGGQGPGPGREREVHSAWQGLLELRRMTNRDGATDRPCDWERAHLVRAAALALEAAGCTPAGAGGVGYRVALSPQPEAVAVRGGPGGAAQGASPPESAGGSAVEGAVEGWAAALTAAGWQVSEHREPRGGARWLLASPRRV